MPTFTLASPVHAELEIRKSRFIGHAVPVGGRDAAMTVVQALRAEHPAATHVCWALLAGGHSGMSDDGEPSGTAGRPMLEVLRHHELDGVLAAVVRYYGGIKLGAGGLVRAYTDAIAACMKQAERVERIVETTLALAVDYPDEARVRRWVEAMRHVLEASSHGADVRMTLRLPLAGAAAARLALRDLTQGRIRFPDDPPAPA